VTTKAGAAGAVSPTRVVVVAGRTSNSADVIAFRDVLEKGGILTLVEGPPRCRQREGGQRPGRELVPHGAERPRRLHGPHARPLRQFATRRRLCAHARPRRAATWRPGCYERRGGAGCPSTKLLDATCYPGWFDGSLKPLRRYLDGSLKPLRRYLGSLAAPASTNRPSLRCGTKSSTVFQIDTKVYRTLCAQI
jgi:hypothetical protein